MIKNVLIFLGFVLLTSCASMYVPNARNVPMLNKAGEVQGQYSFGSSNNLQLAVAVTDHIALMGNGMYADSKQTYSNEVNRYTFGEFGVGYYTNSGKYYFDFFGGYGRGKSTSSDSAFALHSAVPSGYDIHLSSANFNRYFLQPSFGLKRKHFHGAIAYRISLIDFTNGVHAGNAISINRNPVVLLEPAFVAKFPFERFVFSVQAGISTPLNNADLYFDYEPIVISTGIGFRLNYDVKK